MVEKAKALTPEQISKLPQEAQDHIAAMETQLQTQVTEATDATAEVQKALDKANEELAVLKKDESTDPMEGMTSIQKDYFQKQNAKLALLEKAADEAETKEFISKAADMKLPEIEADKFGPVLKEVNTKCSPETAQAVMKALTDAGEVISKAELMKSVGADGEPTGLNENLQALESAAKEIMKSENCSHAVAVTKALELNPSLYQ